MARTTDDDASAFLARWQEWHLEHEARRNAPLGFHAITGLYWLSEHPTTIPDAPGQWRLDGDRAEVELSDGEELTVGSTVIRDRYVFDALEERESLILEFTDGGVHGAIELARRGGSTIVRPRRSDHPFVESYAGTPAFAPRLEWRRDAVFTPFDQPRPTEVGAVVEGLTHVYDAPGTLRIDLDGRPLDLLAFSAGRDLVVLFRDGTSGASTYATGRTVTVAAPDADGRTSIDFTRATNLPCAYTDFATCPLPPAGNHIAIAIEAGEKTPQDRVRAGGRIART